MNNSEFLDKYEENILSHIDKENMNKIILFLEQEHCECLEDILENYLDLFSFDYQDFIDKYNQLNKKYHNRYLEEVYLDMNKLEEFYDIEE